MARALWQQLAIDDVGCAHLAVGLGHGDVLVDRATVVGVVDGIGRDARPVRRAAVVDFADEFAAVVVALHAASLLM